MTTVRAEPRRRTRPMAALHEPVTSGRFVYTTADDVWELHHEDGRGTPWAAFHIPTRWALLASFRSLPDLRAAIRSAALWPLLLGDARQALDQHDFTVASGVSRHDQARAVLDWLGRHAPHCTAEPVTACECGGELACVAGSWGHTGLITCPDPRVRRCECAHRRSGYTCESPVRLDVRCATLNRRRVCCGGCWRSCCGECLDEHEGEDPCPLS